MEHKSSKDLFESNVVATGAPGDQAFVLRLPDELLVRIFESLARRPTTEDYTSYHPVRIYDSGDPDIGFVGLTCRRFRHTSSHLLLHRVSVYLTSASLQRLEAISQHPTIRRGVQSVEVNLCYYDRDLAHDITAFARQVSELLHDKFGARIPPKIAQVHHLGAAMVEACQMRWALQGLSLGQPEDPDENDNAYRELARVAHAYYKESWLEQESILRNGYVGAVASAVARMPSAQRVKLCASTTFNLQETQQHIHIQLPFVRASKERPFQDLASGIRPLFSLLALPFSWTEINRNVIGPPLYEIPLALLFAFMKAGIRPKSLLLDLPLCDDMSYWQLSHEQLEDVSVLGQRIEAFTVLSTEFSLSRGPRASSLLQRPDDLEPLGIFLRTLLHTDRLKSLEMDMRGVDDQGINFPLGVLITVKPLPHLQSLILRGVYLHATDIQVLVSSQEKQIRIVLDEVNLLTGTWTEVLDMLHGKGTEGSDCTHVTGGEYRTIDSKLRAKVFDGPDRGTNLAAECIMGLRPNPLRGADESPTLGNTNVEEDSEGDEEVTDDE